MTNGSLIGCNPAGVTASLLGLPNPTPISYSEFLGTLPNIRGILVVFLRLSFNFNFPGVGNCLYSGNQPALIDTTVAPEPVILSNGGLFMKQAGSAAACPNPGFLTTGPPMLPTQPLTLELIDDSTWNVRGGRLSAARSPRRTAAWPPAHPAAACRAD